MSAPGSLSAAPAAPPYSDRSTGLLVFGIIEIIGGVLTFLLIPLMLLGLVISRRNGGGAPVSSAVTLPLIYGGLAAVLLVLGIGATQAKRWAWALNLILSWIWLIAGVLITTMLIAVLPGSMLAGMKQAAAHNPNPAVPPTTLLAVILTLVIALMAVFLIILPIAFLVFYRSKNVELTCQQRDPNERWTDHIPLPVLAYALLAAFGCLYSIVLGFTTPVFPFFGRYVTGPPATSLIIASALVDGVVAVLFFRLKIAGWWVAVVAMGLRALSAVLTIGKGNLLEAYSHIGRSQKELAMMSLNPMFRGSGMLWVTAAITLGYLVFLLWLKRYFRASASPSYTDTSGPLAHQTASGS